MARDNAAIFHLMNPITGFGDDGIVSGEEQCLLALLHDICSSSKARSELAVSRLTVGSSARITRRSFAKARAMTTGYCPHPESTFTPARNCPIPRFASVAGPL